MHDRSPMIQPVRRIDAAGAWVEITTPEAFPDTPSQGFPSPSLEVEVCV
jgi:hypothetical protein